MALLSGSTNAKPPRFGLMRPAVIIGLLVLGLTRIEDRAMIGVPSLAPDAMAAMAVQPPEDDGTFADEPAGAVPLSGAGQVPRDRIRRALRDRDFAVVAAQGAIPGPVALGTNAPSFGGPAGDNPAAQEVLNALPPAIETTPTNLAGAAPALLSPGSNVFSANIPQADNGGGAGNGGAGNGGSVGAGGGAGGDGTTAPPAVVPGPVAAIPEPASWLFLILGFLGIGAALRRGKPARKGPVAHQVAAS